jgi:acetyl-CoA carboxylase biotin carboxyl carrier protein
MVEVSAYMEASVWRILVQEGESIEEGQSVIILESMKMEIPVEAPIAGTVHSISVSEGEAVKDGDLLLLVREK